jgi:hypothetical protein
MAAYMTSLAKLQGREDFIYYPAHGPAVPGPQKLLRGLVLHRRQREAQILAALASGEELVPVMVERMYRYIDRRLHPAAGRSVLAHLLDLENRGLALREGERWRPSAGAVQA